MAQWQQMHLVAVMMLSCNWRLHCARSSAALLCTASAQHTLLGSPDQSRRSASSAGAWRPHKHRRRLAKVSDFADGCLEAGAILPLVTKASCFAVTQQDCLIECD